MEKILIADLKGDEGPQGPIGADGLPGVLAIDNVTAMASYVLDPAENVFKASLDEKFPQGKVLFLGTSIAAGVGTTDPATKSYPVRAGFHLATMLSGAPLVVVNAGVSADSTTDMRARLAALLKAHRPTIVVVEESINDVALTKAVTAVQTTANMTAMAAMIRVAGAIPIFLTHQQINPAQFNTPTVQTQATQALATQNRKNLLVTAARIGVYVVDIFAITQYLTGVLWDGLHPNDRAANIWGYAIARAIVSYDMGQHFDLSLDDTFARTSTTTIGAGWTTVGSTWGTDGANAYCVTGYDGAVVTTEGGGTDVSFTSVITASSGAIDGGILVRSNGTATGYLVVYIGADLVLFVLNAGGVVELGRSVGAALPGVPVTINASGPNLLVSIDGAPVISAVNSAYTAGTKVGLRYSANALVRWAYATTRITLP